MGKATSSNCEEGRFAAGTKLLGMNSATSYFSSLGRGQWLERLTNLRYGENPVSVTHPLDAMNGINLVLLNTRWGLCCRRADTQRSALPGCGAICFMVWKLLFNEAYCIYVTPGILIHGVVCRGFEWVNVQRLDGGGLTLIFWRNWKVPRGYSVSLRSRIIVGLRYSPSPCVGRPTIRLVLEVEL